MKQIFIVLIAVLFFTSVKAQSPSVEVLNEIIAGFENQFDDLYGEEVSELEALYKSSVVFDERAEELIYGEDYYNPVYEVKYDMRGMDHPKIVEQELLEFLNTNLSEWSYSRIEKKSNIATHMYTKEGADYIIELSIPVPERGNPPSRVILQFYKSSE